MIIDNAVKLAMLKRMEDHPLLEKRTSRVKGLIFGEKGVGKTVTGVGLLRKLIGPESLIVFIDTNEGYESLRNHKSLMKNVLPIPFESVEQLYVIAEAIYKNIAPFTNVGAIIFDDADFMAAKTLNMLWHNRVDRGGSKSDPEKPDQPEYLKLGFMFVEVLEYIFSMTPTVHVLITTHTGEKWTKDRATLIKIHAGFNPALTKEVSGRLQFCVYMTAKEVKMAEKAIYLREIQAHPTYLIDAKTRIGCDKIKYEVSEFVKHVDAWIKEGRPEDDELTAIRRDIETSKVVTEDDIFGNATEVDDEAPVMME